MNKLKIKIISKESKFDIEAGHNHPSLIEIIKKIKKIKQTNLDLMVKNLVIRNLMIDIIIKQEKENLHMSAMKENLMKMKGKKEEVKNIEPRKSIMKKKDYRRKQNTKQKESNGKQIDPKNLMNQL